jgi:hypothetical protein
MHILMVYSALFTSGPGDGLKHYLDLVASPFAAATVIVYAHFAVDEVRLNAPVN